MNKNIKLIILGLHGAIQMAGGALAFITWRHTAAEIVSLYLFLTGALMVLHAYNNVVLKVYLSEKVNLSKTKRRTVGIKQYLEV